MSHVPIPSVRDRQRALRGTLARLRGDHDVVPLLLAEMRSPDDLARCALAAMDALGAVMQRRLRDPVGYLESWLALEQQLLDDLDDDTAAGA